MLVIYRIPCLYILYNRLGEVTLSCCINSPTLAATPTSKNTQASSKDESRADTQESSKGKGHAEAEDIDGDWYMV